MYFMDKENRIEHHYFTTDTRKKGYGYFILVEFVEGIPAKSYVVTLPKDFKFWDTNYPYYCFNDN